jgi:hypothetical protein
MIFVSGPRPFLTGARRTADGAFRFQFEDAAGTNYTVLASTNVAAPLAAWEVLGRPVRVGDGVYEFSDAFATIFPRRFYLLRE